MKAVGLLLSILFLSLSISARTLAPAPQQNANSFPAPDFVLSTGSSSAQAHCLSFSAYGKTLAVGFSPSRVDLWDVASRKKLRSINAGPACAISSDGRFLATGGKSIDIWDASSGKRIKTLAWKPKTANSTVDNVLFNPATTVLDVSVNGEGASLYEIPSGKLITVLENAQRSQFSSDGASLIGGNAKHLTVWSTRDWSVIRDLSISSDDVTSIAADPEKDLIFVGGAKSARVLYLSSAHEIATFGTASTNFATFSKRGTLVLTNSPSGLAVWEISGHQLCGQSTMGNSATTISDDDRWLAASVSDGKASVGIWDLQKALRQCGANSAQTPAPPAIAPEKSPIAQGRSRFVDYKCGDCHGANGEGGPDGPDLTTTYMDAGMISRFLDKPSPDAYMKGMPSIPATHPDNKSLVAYVVSLKRAPTPK